MLCSVLFQVNPMIGLDFHDGLIPAAPVPVPAPKMPHVCAAMLHWAVPPSSMAKTVQTMGFFPMQQGHDIANLVPHVSIPPTNILMPLVIGFSGSKAYFGASTVQVDGKPVAVALIVFVNLNLNCHGAAVPPAPTGVVITWNTVMAGFTLGDFLGGLFQMIVEAAIQYGLNKLFASKGAERFFGRISGAVGRAAGRMGSALAQRVGGRLGAAMVSMSARALGNSVVRETLKGAIPGLTGMLLGSPLGYAPGWAPIGNAASGLGGLANQGGQGLGNALTGGVETFPAPAGG